MRERRIKIEVEETYEESQNGRNRGERDSRKDREGDEGERRGKTREIDTKSKIQSG